MRRRQRAVSIRVQITLKIVPKINRRTDVMMVIFSSLRAARNARRSGSQAADRLNETVTGHRPQGKKLHERKQVALNGSHGLPSTRPTADAGRAAKGKNAVIRPCC